MTTRKILFLALFVPFFAFAQKTPPPNWFNLDLKKDKVPGVSTEKAYNELLKGKTSKTVIVAVIDGGTEVAHEDLKDVIWVNEKEIPNNGIDDDNNGYIDDINGWSFLGGKDTNVVEDSYEITRVYKMYSDKFKNADPLKLTASEKADYEKYVNVKKFYETKLNEYKGRLDVYVEFKNTIAKVIKETGTQTPTPEQVSKVQPASPIQAGLLESIKSMAKKKVPLNVASSQFDGAIDYFNHVLKFGYNLDFDPRGIIGDDYENVNERYYGSNYVSGPKGEHGTHVAGIIAASRNNNIGMKGVADNVKIMVLRVVPDGDERDKDVANAIRYAADNGAKVINMSFGKTHSPYKAAVDEAVRYAESKDVLLVHAAGNDSKNTDTENNFPRDIMDDGKEVSNWIEVGAVDWKGGKHTPARFSNYGKTNVDVFAPGVDIYSSIPFSSYATYNGTSMASPVTAGVAALVRSYYPNLPASYVKTILLDSATPIKGKVIIPGEKKKKTKMKELCKTGGVINAYEALRLAEGLSAVYEVLKEAK